MREQVLGKLESFSEDQTLVMTKLCWNMFYQMVEDQAQSEFAKVLTEVEAGKADLKTAMYKEIENKIYKDFMEKLRRGEEGVALEAVRRQIEETVKQTAQAVTAPQ